MPDKVTFRGARIRYFDGRTKEGNSYCRIHMSAEFTKPVMDAMDWEDPGHSVQKADLEGELIGTQFTLTPNDKKLREFGIALDINLANAFKIVTITDDEVSHRELRFVVRSPSADAVALVDNYLRKVGDAEAALIMSYTVQEELALTAATGPSTGAAAPVQ